MDKGTQFDIFQWYKPNYDLRIWESKHEQMGNGITMTGKELIILSYAIESLSLYGNYYTFKGKGLISFCFYNLVLRDIISPSKSVFIFSVCMTIRQMN